MTRSTSAVGRAASSVPAALPDAGLGYRYYALLSAYLVSSLGNWLYRFTLPLLVLHLTGSAIGTAAVYALEYGPFLLLSLPGGVFADRMERRRLLVLGDSVAAAITIGLAVMLSAGVSSVAAVYVVAFLLACVEPMYHPAFQGIIPQLVPARELGRANAWMQSGDNTISLVGPVAAGVCVAVLGYEPTIWFDALTFVASALLISTLRSGDRAPAPPARPPIRRQVSEGAAYVFHGNRMLLAGALLFTGTNFGIWLVQGNLVYYLTTYLDLSPTLIGVVFTAQGAGAAVGAAVAGWAVRRYPPNRLIIWCTVLAGAAMLALVPARGVWSMAPVWAVVYALGSVNVVSWFTLRQQIVPTPLLGRVVAVTRMLSFASIPVAALVAGLVETAWHDMYAILLIGGAFRAGVGLLALRTPLNKVGVASVEPQPTV